jgi:serine/threonine-protein kinase HipA
MLISNIDDHPRNHALIAKGQEWKLSPAYDLTPSPVIAQDRRDLAVTVGDQGRFANAKNLVSQHTRFLLDADEAKAIVAEMTNGSARPGTTLPVHKASARRMRKR